jgi:hypothetical protein
VLARVEGRLAADGEAHAVALEALIDRVAAAAHRLPHLVGVGGGRAGFVAEAADDHRERHVVGATVGGAFERRRERWDRGAAERDVALAGEQARGRVEPDPAGAGQVDLAPCVQIDDVAGDALGLVGQHAFVGELHEVARDEARREPALAQEGGQEHGRVAARGLALGEALFGGVDAGLLADDVAHRARDRGVELAGQRHGRARAGQGGRERGEARVAMERRVVEVEKRRELVLERRRVLERDLLGELLEEEVERVHRAHVDRQLDQDVERARRLVGDEVHLGDVVAVRVLLPAQGRRRLDQEAVGLDARLRVRRRSEPQRVRSEVGGARVAVAAAVLDQKPHSPNLRRIDVGVISTRDPARHARSGRGGQAVVGDGALHVAAELALGEVRGLVRDLAEGEQRAPIERVERGLDRLELGQGRGGVEPGQVGGREAGEADGGVGVPPVERKRAAVAVTGCRADLEVVDGVGGRDGVDADRGELLAHDGDRARLGQGDPFVTTPGEGGEGGDGEGAERVGHGVHTSGAASAIGTSVA